MKSAVKVIIITISRVQRAKVVWSGLVNVAVAAYVSNRLKLIYGVLLATDTCRPHSVQHAAIPFIRLLLRCQSLRMLGLKCLELSIALYPGLTLKAQLKLQEMGTPPLASKFFETRTKRWPLTRGTIL